MEERCKQCGSKDFGIARDMKSTRHRKCGFSWPAPPKLPKKLTDWEVGQEMIAISDFISERTADFKESHPHLFAMLNEMRLTIGDEFNKMGSHDFSIAAHKGPA